MKKIIGLITLLAILTTFSCKEDDGIDGIDQPKLETTGSLYLRFEINGEEKEYSSTNGFWGGGSSINGKDTYATLSGFSNGDLTFDFSKNEITLEDLLALEGKTIPFGSGDDINAMFRMGEDGIDAASNQIDSHNATSSISIIDAYENGTNPLGKLVRITGTFQCQIKEVGGLEMYEITNGEFSLVFQEI